MDSFFGIGLPELILILLLAGMVMGPQRIRHVARTLGRITAQLQNVSREFARQLNSELDALDDDQVKGSLTDLRELQAEVQALRRELSQAPRSMVGKVKEAVADGEEALSSDEGIRVQSPADGEESEDEERSALPKPIEVPDDPEL